MEWITTIVIALIGSGGGGLLGWMLAAKSARRKSDAEATLQEAEANLKGIEADARQIAYFKTELNDAYAQIEKLQNMMDEKRVLILDLKRRLTDFELAVLEAERLQKLAQYNECRKNCPDREPPRTNKVSHL